MTSFANLTKCMGVMDLTDRGNGADREEQQRLQYAAQHLFPETVSVHAEFISGRGLPQLIGREKEFIENACDRRKREFATGRLIARQCLESFGVGPVELLPYKEGNIRWPDGYTGTISHAGPWCLVAVAPITFARGMGIDIENEKRMTDGIAERIMSEREKELFNVLDDVSEKAAATICFCAKEAIYKAAYPILKTYLSFKDVEIMPQTTTKRNLTFQARIIKLISPNAFHLEGRISMHGKWIIAGIYI